MWKNYAVHVDLGVGEKVLAVTEGWEDQMREADVSASDIAVLERSFAY